MESDTRWHESKRPAVQSEKRRRGEGGGDSVYDVQYEYSRCGWGGEELRAAARGRRISWQRSTDLTVIVERFVKAVAVNVAQVFVLHVYVDRQLRGGERRSAALRGKHWIASGAGRPYGHQARSLRCSVRSCNETGMNGKNGIGLPVARSRETAVQGNRASRMNKNRYKKILRSFGLWETRGTSRSDIRDVRIFLSRLVKKHCRNLILNVGNYAHFAFFI